MSSKEFYNWCKLQFLLNTRASELLRSLFKKLWQARFNKDWDSSSGQELFDMIKQKKGFKKSYHKFQRDLLQAGDIHKWDLQLLRKVFFDSDIYGAGKQGDDYKKNAEKLVDFRNKLEHNASRTVSNNVFRNSWANICNILVEMGDSKEELGELKGSMNLQKMVIMQGQNIAKANELKNEGKKFCKKKKYTEAISSYTNAIDLEGIPDQYLAILYSNRSTCYLKRWSESKNNSDDIQSVLKDAKECKKLRPEWSKAYFHLGKAYVELNKLDKARKALERALVLEPNNEEIKTLLNDTRNTKREQDNYEHLDPGMSGMSIDEWLQDFKVRTGMDINMEQLNEFTEFAESEIPGLEDVGKGNNYRDGIREVKQDFAMAAKYYQKAVEKGNAEAMYNLGKMTQYGRGVKQDFALAFFWYKRAAEQPPLDPMDAKSTVGIAEAEHAIGTWYSEGIYVWQDKLQAAYWYERAIEHGAAWSANNLGLFYMHGQGVKQDLKKAEQLLLLAASRNDYNAPNNLVVLYKLLNSPEKALKWNKISIEKGSVLATSKQEELESTLSGLQETLEQLGVVEWEKANKLAPDDLTLEERIQRRITFNQDPQITNLFENAKKTFNEIFTPKKPLNQTSWFKYDIRVLEKFRHTSETAKTMYKATIHFFLCFEILRDLLKDTQSIGLNNKLCEQFIANLAECYRIEHIVARFPINQITDAKNIAEKIISQIHTLRQKKSLTKELTDLDQDARLCFAVLSVGSPKTLIDFLSDSLQKYPQNQEFFMFRGNTYGIEQRHEDALRDFNRLLEMEPDNFNFLYCKAVSLRLLGHPSTVKAYEEYLEEAPIDDRKRPEAYYSMGVFTFYSSNQSKESKNQGKNKATLMEKIMKEYYDLGLEMEKKQLPFFLPYESNCKKVLEMNLNPSGFFEKKEQSCKQEKPKLKDPLRKELIIDQRRCIMEWGRAYSMKEWIKISISVKPSQKQKFPKSLIGMKPVYLNEIDFTKDHVLNGYILEVTAINPPFYTGSSIMLVVEDKNGHVQRTALYNLDESKTDVQKLCVGSKFSIINPYIRMAGDGKPMIRVNDPSTVIFGEKMKNMCACCGDVSQNLVVCGGCKNTVYCSEECQKIDWKKFKHSLICAKK